MKLKWREHERTLITLLLLLVLGRYYWSMMRASQEKGFPAWLPPLEYYGSNFLPKAGPVLLLYFCYLWANIKIVPRFHLSAMQPAAPAGFMGRVRIFLKRYSWQLVQIIALYFVLCMGLSFADKRGGRSILFVGRGSTGDRIVATAFLLLVFYGVYAFVRESMIDYIERAGDRREYLAMVLNRVTLFILRISLLVGVFGFFDFIHDWSAAIAFYSFVACTFLIGMANIYWLFPKYGKERLFNVPLLSRLTLLNLAAALLFYIIFFPHGGARPVAPFSLMWMFGLFIVTPVSWWIYLYRKDHILQLRGMEKALVQSRSSLAFLRAQINPHFLFNVLNTLYGTALQEKADRTAEGIQKLGDMMRFMLHENNLEQIKMSREIEYLENYIALQKLRTAASDAIVIEDDIVPARCGHTIAPMLLIPFVENAFKHGISLQERSWIKIALRCDDRHIYFETRNSVHARPAADPGREASGIGLNNVRERLQWLYPGRHDLHVGGTAQEFVVKLMITV